MKTFRDLMGEHTGAEIISAITGNVVRQLVVIDNTVDIKAGPDQVGVPLDTKISYDPWLMDRGSLLFTADFTVAKLCTELDIIKYDDDSQCVILWDDDSKGVYLAPTRDVR